MVLERSGLIPRVAGLVLFVVFVLFFRRAALFDESYPDAAGMSESVIPSLKVAVRQVSSSPPTLAIGVTNTHSSPVTVLSWNSPLDPLAVQLGLVSFTPAGSNGPVEIPKLMVRRKLPPGPESLVTIEPGETKEQVLELKERVVPLETLRGKVRVVCHGSWMGVWASKADDIAPESLESLGVSEDGSGGKFESQPVEIEL
ncbi:hypothetical protein F5X96DRAFT_316744 [Biscogniauxia mediterranea]|nr:hypothetical protein F5X96DRAFT_316744 [Biscogniauxia mediterranea]